jgi:hypothetical protein
MARAAPFGGLSTLAHSQIKGFSLDQTNYSAIFEPVKTPILLKFACNVLLACVISVYSLVAVASTPGGSWFEKYRQQERVLSSTIYNKSKEPMKFFNGFAIGAGAGVGLFHGDLADYDIFAPFSDFSTYYQFAWRVHVRRDLKWGLGAQLHFEAGTLGGGRVQGKQSPKINFTSEYRTLALSASFDLLGEFFRKDKKKEYKTYLNAEAGIGLTWYRAYTNWTGEDERVRDWQGYNVTDINPPTQRYTLDGRAKAPLAINIPIGFTFGYRVNYKTDITFNYTLNNLLTDELDAKSLDWTANDKYAFFGLGLRYNFNREPENYPAKKPKKDKDADNNEDKNRKWKLFGSAKEDVQPKDVKLEGPIESRQGNTVDPAVANPELEAVRMKMFELQLKLFEMQYLLGGGKAKEE